MRKRRARGQQAAVSGVFLWVFVYAFRTLFRRGLDNPLPPHQSFARSPLRRAFQRFNCVDRRHFQPGHTRLPQQNGNLKTQAETPFPYLHASSPLFRPVFCVLPQRPCVHYTELFFGFVGRSLTKPAQIVDIFLSAWDFSCVFISGRPKTGIFAAAVQPHFLLTASSGYAPFLHSIIHISCLVFIGGSIYNK